MHLHPTHLQKKKNQIYTYNWTVKQPQIWYDYNLLQWNIKVLALMFQTLQYWLGFTMLIHNLIIWCNWNVWKQVTWRLPLSPRPQPCPLRVSGSWSVSCVCLGHSGGWTALQSEPCKCGWVGHGYPWVASAASLWVHVGPQLLSLEGHWSGSHIV